MSLRRGPRPLQPSAGDDPEPTGWICIAGTVADITVWYLFWAFIVALPETAYYLPMDAMAITPAASALLAPLGGVLLASDKVRFAVSQRRVQAALLVASLCGIGSMWIRYSPEWHLTILGVGTLCSFLGVAGRLMEQRSPNAFATYYRQRAWWGLGVGCLVYTAIRFCNYSLSPLMTHNAGAAVGIIAGILAAAVMWCEEEWLGVPDKPDDSPRNGHTVQEAMIGGLSIGGLIFLTGLLFSEYSAMPRYLDVTPSLGVLTGVGLALGWYIGFAYPSFVASSWGYQIATGGAGSVLFLFCSAASIRMQPEPGADIMKPWSIEVPPQEWNGYYGSPTVSYLGGVLMAVYAASSWAPLIDRVIFVPLSKPTRSGGALGSGQVHPGVLFGFLFLGWLIPTAMSVYIQVFAFVPLGWLLRNRTWAVVGVPMLFVQFGLMLVSSMSTTTVILGNVAQGMTSYPFRRLRTVVSGVSGTMCGMVLLSMLIRPPVAPLHPPARSEPIRAMIWAIHFGYDNKGLDSFAALTQDVKNTRANVVALLESDLTHLDTGNRDIGEYMGRTLGMYVDFGPPSLDNTFGCMLLSAFPILRAKHYVIPSPDGELACLIDAAIRVNDTNVNVVVAHFGNTPHVRDRELQARALADVAAKYEGPMFFLGYITARYQSPNYNIIVNSRTGFEDTTDDDTRYCEYVFKRQLKQLSYVKIDSVRKRTSDTEIMRAEFVL